MRLSDLIQNMEICVMNGTKEIDIREIQYDSRKIQQGDVFVCIKGSKVDGHEFVSEAVRKGAAALVVEEMLEVSVGNCTVIRVEDTRKAMARMAVSFFGQPAKELTVIGITGTKGKTTVSYMILAGIREAGQKAGYMGTTHIDTGRRCVIGENTTPESLEIHQYLREMADCGCRYAVLEVSSQALKLDRTEGIIFDIGVFTNLSRDHIGKDEHKDMKEYLECKKKLFCQCRLGIGNGDSLYLDQIWKNTTCEKQVYCLEGNPYGNLSLSMPGKFNRYNAIAAAMVLEKLGIPKKTIRKGLESVRVPGRMEKVEGIGDYQVYVDYAHNGASLRGSIETLRECNFSRVIVVFGCGGNRSRERRIQMGRAAGECADFSVITTDNPRFEDPGEIIKDIVIGMKQVKGRFQCVEDRKAAILYALSYSRPGDVILVAGKGHEKYQEIEGIRYPMDDRELVRTCTQILS